MRSGPLAGTRIIELAGIGPAPFACMMLADMGADVLRIDRIASDAIGEPGRAPVPPLNLVADFGGGGMLLAFGLVCGLLEARSSGRGQVIDAAMTDGASLLMAWTATLRNAGQWEEQRGANLLDGGAPNYTTYRTSDGEYLAVGAMERQLSPVRVAGRRSSSGESTRPG
jgi:crotonobetainyl-CoA:carnitine CoA-transferase CaiB-like acyl-CoA transferase